MSRSVVVLLAAATLSQVAAAQNGTAKRRPLLVPVVAESLPPALRRLDTLSVDSAAAERAATPFRRFLVNEARIVVSVNRRLLWVIAGEDTLRRAVVSVASGHDLSYGGRRWRFQTPRGRLVVRGRRVDPVWVPPDWHYAEVAREHGLRLRRLPPKGVRLPETGSRLVIRDSVIGIIRKDDSTFLALPLNEHVVFESTLFIPPASAKNRRLRGELGRFALDLGDGYLLHGTPDESTIGLATTHGCIRLADNDLEWIYARIPVGATVIVR